MSKAFKDYSVPAVSCPVADAADFMGEVRAGRIRVEIPVSSPNNDGPAHLWIVAWLLQDCVVNNDVTKRLTAYELKFLGDVAYKKLSDPMRGLLKRIALNRIGYDIDANTTASS